MNEMHDKTIWTKPRNRVQVQLFHDVPFDLEHNSKEDYGEVGVVRKVAGRDFFGLLDSEGYMTICSHGLDSFDPLAILDNIGEDGWFYFYEGNENTGTKISYRELKRAFEELDLI